MDKHELAIERLYREMQDRSYTCHSCDSVEWVLTAGIYGIDVTCAWCGAVLYEIGEPAEPGVEESVYY